MLRMMFNQPRRIDKGLILKTNTSIADFCSLLTEMQNQKTGEKYARLTLLANGFIDALNELEQSKYCSMEYSLKVVKPFVEGMEPEELEFYQLHIYFYKNALIRIFSILDKLGYFMNDLFDLETGKVKEKFSYFTVLRHMYKLQNHPELEKLLFDIKVTHQEPMSKLRKKRNMEIHHLNAELLDDLQNLTREKLLEPLQIEDLVLNMDLLQKGYEMVCYSLDTVFTYAVKKGGLDHVT
jgi:hypothetical protein